MGMASATGLFEGEDGHVAFLSGHQRAEFLGEFSSGQLPDNLTVKEFTDPQLAVLGEPFLSSFPLLFARHHVKSNSYRTLPVISYSSKRPKRAGEAGHARVAASPLTQRR
jgi:hypothetical protein